MWRQHKGHNAQTKDRVYTPLYISMHYYEAMVSEINAIVPDGYAHLEQIDQWNTDKALLVLKAILSRGCQAQNSLNITLSREAYQRLPVAWLSQHLSPIVDSTLDLRDEWEYRRLVEMLFVANSPETQKYIDIGHASDDPDIREAAEDFQEAYLRFLRDGTPLFASSG